MRGGPGEAYGLFDIVPAGMGGGGGSAKTITALYNFVGSPILICGMNFTVVWSDDLSLTLDYSRDGDLSSDAAYAAATWHTIPVTPEPSSHSGTVGPQSWSITLPYFLDCNLLRLTCVGSGGSSGSAKLTDFRVTPAPMTPNLWSSGDSGRWYPAPLLVDRASGDGTTGYDGV